MLEYNLWPIDNIAGDTRSRWSMATNVTVEVSPPDAVPPVPQFEVSTEDGANWLSVQYSDSNIFAQGSGRSFALFTYMIVLDASVANLPCGSYRGSITFSTSDWSQTIPVSLGVPGGLVILKPARKVLYLDEGNSVGVYYANLFPLPYTIRAWSPTYKLTTSPISRDVSNSVGSVYFRVQAPNPPLTGGPQYLFFIGPDGATCSVQVLQTRPVPPPPAD